MTKTTLPKISDLMKKKKIEEPVEELPATEEEIETPIEEPQQTANLEDLFKHLAQVHGGICSISLIASEDGIDILSTQKLVENGNQNIPPQ